MDIQDQENGNAEKVPSPIAAGAAPINPARRRFTGASGIILTLVSQPGMATTQRVCTAASGSMSGGLQSQPTNQTVVCGGLSPGYWKNHPESWPAGVYPKETSLGHGRKRPATSFSSVFPGGGEFCRSASLMDMVECIDPSKDRYNLGCHLVAAYLNVKSHKISYLTVESLQDMWRNVLNPGTYSPSAGVFWGPERVKIYLESTEG